MSYYINSSLQLSQAISQRNSMRDIVSQRLDQWIESVYGIKNFSEKKNFFLGIHEHNSTKPVGALCRQIPSVTIEDLSLYCGCIILGLAPRVYSFIEDNFSTQNAEKVSRIKIPRTKWSKKGNLILEYDFINNGNRDLQKLDGLPLNRIETKSGLTLDQYHQRQREEFFGSMYPNKDVSNFYFSLAKEALLKPEKVFYRNHNGLTLSSPYNDSLEYFRPSSKWYYPLYLSFFLDGTTVLMETYENPNGEVFQAKKLFIESMDHIKNMTGFYPLVVQTPHLDKDQLSCPQSVLDTMSAQDLLGVARKSINTCDNTVTLFQNISDIIQRTK